MTLLHGSYGRIFFRLSIGHVLPQLSYNLGNGNRFFRKSTELG